MTPPPTAPDAPPAQADGGPRPGRARRLDAVLDLVVATGHVQVDELVEALDISPATARRDLDALAAQQLVIRTRGGATLPPQSGDLPLRYRAAGASREKERIADAAARLVAPGDVVAVNGGTTTTALAHALATRPALVEAERDTVLVTNAVNIAQELAVRRHLQLVVTGGVLRDRSYELVGRWAESLLKQISIDTLFLGVNAVDAELGACADSDSEATMASQLVARSGAVVVLADSSKVGRGAFARICPAERIDTVITDDGVDPEAVAALQAAGIDVQIV